MELSLGDGFLIIPLYYLASFAASVAIELLLALVFVASKSNLVKVAVKINVLLIVTQCVCYLCVTLSLTDGWSLLIQCVQSG